VARNGRAWICSHHRRLLQYQFVRRTRLISLGQRRETLDRAVALAFSRELRKIQTPPARKLSAWNAEGWYVELYDSRRLAFTSEYGTKPPEEIVALFQEIKNMPGIEESSYYTRDVCLGFCYGPAAALGLVR